MQAIDLYIWFVSLYVWKDSWRKWRYWLQILPRTQQNENLNYTDFTSNDCSATFIDIMWIKLKKKGIRMILSCTEVLQNCDHKETSRQELRLIFLHTFEMVFWEVLYWGTLMCLGIFLGSMVSGPEGPVASSRFLQAVILCASMVPLDSKPCTVNFHLNSVWFQDHIPAFNK
jgi:hypothetical protein